MTADKTADLTPGVAPALRTALAAADALAASGRVAAAAQAYAEVRTQARQRGDRPREAIACLQLAHLADDANSLQASRDHAMAGLHAAKADASGASATVEGALRLHLALLYTGLGDLATARQHLADFDALPADVQAVPPLAWSRAMLAAHWARRGGEVTAARDAAQRAAQAAASYGDPRAQAEAAALRAELEAPQNPEARRAMAQRLWTASRATPGARHAANCLTLGLACADNGDDAVAEHHFDEALAHWTAARAQWSGPTRHHLMEAVAPGVQTIVAWRFDRDKKTAGFEASEHAQGCALLDAMAEGRGLAAPPAPSLPVVQRALAAEGAHLLKFFYAGRRLLAWWVPPQGALRAWDASATLPAIDALIAMLVKLNRPATLARAADRGGEVPAWRGAAAAAFDDPGTWTRLAAGMGELGATLFPPDVAAALAAPSNRNDALPPLVVVPHLALFMLPWAAIVPGGGEGPPLCAHWSVTLAPSAGAWLLDADRPPAAGPTLVVADCGRQRVALHLVPDDPASEMHWRFGSLAGAQDEGREVHGLRDGTLLEGDDATLAAVRAALPAAACVHLATHGLWVPAGELSFVLLAGTAMADDGAGFGDNALLGRELERTRLKADLVVLSACQSGLGALHLDSAIGLGPSLLAGGVRAVLLSLWPLDDAMTLRFMGLFHAALARGMAPAVALARTQKDFRDRPDTANGLLWAGLFLLGHPAAQSASSTV